MSYQSQATLEADFWFQQRSRACALGQANVTPPDVPPEQAALAAGLLRDDAGLALAFARFIAAFPGLADGVTDPDGTVDQAKVTDATLLAQTAAAFPTIALLYFDPEGNPLT
jgi:hypothetical protein